MRIRFKLLSAASLASGVVCVLLAIAWGRSYFIDDYVQHLSLRGAGARWHTSYHSISSREGIITLRTDESEVAPWQTNGLQPESRTTWYHAPVYKLAPAGH